MTALINIGKKLPHVPTKEKKSNYKTPHLKVNEIFF